MIKKRLFGKHNGKDVYAYTLTSSTGTEIEVIEYGGIITKFLTPDKQGKLANIVLGHNTLEEYENDTYYLGCICGRTSGRITNGLFMLDGKQYRLSRNSENLHLHGGNVGFNKVLWSTKEHDNTTLSLTYISPDGEEGYPGELTVNVSYTLVENTLTINYHATTTKNTIVSLTNHSYFNLSGNFGESISDHFLTIPGDNICELNDDLTPTGNFTNILNTPLDFTKSKEIGGALKLLPNGIDHPYVLNKNADNVILHHPKTGRRLTVSTTAPGVVVYTGNSLPNKQTALCLETQRLPDAINHPNFPSIILKPGDIYKSETKWEC
ncbi:MAG: galactose mutarotase [Defluviitaleaceae bacterium]|nr:galactose mutarotase [Defluviitaleaceae bacterium]